jgi:glycine cleavage system H protein
MKLDTNARYVESHEWVRKDGDELVVGISDHAQHSLGDIVFVDLPKVGASLAAKATFGVIESTKAASDIYMPLAGKISAVNETLADSPDLINQDCYGEGWIIKIVPNNAADFDKLLSAEDYGKIAEE